MSDWEEASREDRLLALIFARSPLWLRWTMKVTVYLPGSAGCIFDRLERYRNERALREWRTVRVTRGVRK